MAVPTPNNGILLKRFFTAVAVVKEFYTKGNQSSELFAVSSTPRSLPAYIKKHPTIAPPFSEIARPSIKDHRSGAMEATPLLNSEIGECEYANRFFSLFALNDGHAASATNQTMPSCKQCAKIMNSIRGERKEPWHCPAPQSKSASSLHHGFERCFAAVIWWPFQAIGGEKPSYAHNKCSRQRFVYRWDCYGTGVAVNIWNVFEMRGKANNTTINCWGTILSQWEIWLFESGRSGGAS